MTPRQSPRVLHLASCSCPLQPSSFSRPSSRPSTRALPPSPPLRVDSHCSLSTPPSSTFCLSRYPLRRTATLCLKAPSDLNPSLVLFPLRALACARPMFLFPYCSPSVHGLLLYFFQPHFFLDYQPLWLRVLLLWPLVSSRPVLLSTAFTLTVPMSFILSCAPSFS